MKRGNVINLSIVFGILLMLTISCEKKNCKTCDEPPILDYQEFSIEENSPNGTIIDTVKASNFDSTHAPVFEIIGGDPERIFSIDPELGVIYVADFSRLDYELNTFHELAVKVTVNKEIELTSSNTIKINVIDIKPTQDGLVAYYPFEGNAFDVIGENTGVENNVEYFSSSYTVPNQVIAFNGVNSYVDLQNDFDYETMTINLWFNALKFENVFGIIYTSDNPQLNFGLTNIVIRNDDNINHLYFNVSGQNEIVEIEENSWYNVTMIRDKKSYRYYLNGALIGSGEFTEYYTSNNGKTTAILGCLRTLDMRFFNGLVDNLRIYNKALSASEIKVLFQE